MRRKEDQAREKAGRRSGDRTRGYRTEQCGGWGGRRAALQDWPGAHLVESHLVDFLRRTALFPGAQFVAQLLWHCLHHVVPQLYSPHFCPCVLVILGEFGQVESQALAELVEDPEGEGEAGEGAGGEWTPLPTGLGEERGWVG